MWRKGIKAKYSILLYTLYMKLQDMYDAEKQFMSREWAGSYFILWLTKQVMCSVKVFLAYLQYICEGEEMPSGGLVHL